MLSTYIMYYRLKVVVLSHILIPDFPYRYAHMEQLKKPKKFTAFNFKLQPAIVYRTADLEGVVEIEHSHYPHKQIFLVSKNRETNE